MVHVSDIETEDLEPAAREAYRRIRLRAVVAVPMIHDGRPIGVISVSRGTPGPFADRQIDLLRTFADQAVIAIQNVRLFKELEARNRDLTEALEQQTATAEILRVISSSPTDVQPVFETIVASAGRLCAAESAAVYRFEDGDGSLRRPLQFRSRDHRDLPPRFSAAHFRRPITSGGLRTVPCSISPTSRGILTRRPGSPTPTAPAALGA